MNKKEIEVFNMLKFYAFIAAAPVQGFYANDNSSMIPQRWAMESLLILQENMVASSLVHRDFENEIREYGDTVNTRKPNNFVAKRKTDADDVTDQDAISSNVQVKLDQHVHVSFVIKDGERSKAFADLVNVYVRPALLAHATFLDQIILGQYAQFLDNSVGKLGTAVSESTYVDLNTKFNVNKAYVAGRNLILNPNSNGDSLKLGLFVQAQQAGDGGQALRDAWIGRKYGFGTYMCQNMSTVATGNTVVTGAVNNASGYAAGTTTMAVDGLSAALPVNAWFTVAGDATPQRIVSSVGGATPTSVTFAPGLRSAVVDNAVITIYTPGAINNSGGYAAGYAKMLTVDTFSVAPRVGQFLTFGTSTSSNKAVNPIYTIIEVSGTTGITLDRPLEVAVSDNDTVNIGPAGNYNFAFHQNAIALVTRPLAAPPDGVGAASAVVNYGGMGLRVTMTYDGKAQGTRVTIDALCGIKALDQNLGGVMLG